MLDWKKHKLESRLPWELSITSNTQMRPHLRQKAKKNQRLLKVKVGLKLNIQKTNIMASSPITSWQIDEETMETVRDYFGGLQNHCRLPGAGAPLWQRSWGRRLGIHKGGIKPQESPWKYSSIYPQNQSLPTFCFVLSPTPLTLRGAVPHYLSLKKELAYSSS